jgi:predicted permease
MSTTLFYFDDRSEDETGGAGYVVTGPDYFETLDIPLLEGRLFDSTDRAGGEHVAVVSRDLVERYWPEGDALGKRIRPPGMDLWGDQSLTIVGVVGDVRHNSVTSSPYRMIYVPYAQRAFRTRWATVVLETEGDAAALVPTLRDRLRQIAPELPVTFETFDEVLTRSISRHRFNGLVLSSFAALALLLAAGGIWAVVAYQVAQRSRELGVRIALGASPGKLVALVLHRTVWVVAIGAVVGFALALALGRLLESLLFEIEPTDPTTLAVVAMLFLAIGAVASIVPALRATRVDPIVTLRSD